jgi:hypothetical protein
MIIPENKLLYKKKTIKFIHLVKLLEHYKFFIIFYIISNK